jgi:hypothetical protein
MMKGIVKKILLSASVVASLGGIASLPAQAAILNSANITGTDATSANDYIKYDFVAPNTLGPSPGANLVNLLGGNVNAPTGNVELFATSEVGFPSLASFLNYDKVTTLNVGFDDGSKATFSSLTATDLFGAAKNTAYTANTLATKWFNDAFSANFAANSAQLASFGITNETSLFTTLSLLGYSNYSSREKIYNLFLNAGGFQRAVDPNIAYVNKDGNVVSFGLAGHLNLFNQIPGLPTQFQNFLNFQASELVKVAYNNDPSQVFYSFNGTPSGLTSNDTTNSFNATYPFSFNVPPQQSVPEPSAVLGLIAVGGLFVAKRKLQKQA